MSDFETAARPYSRAIFELANEQNKLSEWSDVLQLAALIATDESMRALIDSPAILPSQVSETFLSVMADTKDAPEVNQDVTNVIKLLAENDRLRVIPAIHHGFDVLKQEAEGAVEVQVISARKLTVKQQKDMSESLKKRLGKEINLSTEIDKSLIAGAIIHAGDLVIDGSAKGRLEKLTTLLNR